MHKTAMAPGLAILAFALLALAAFGPTTAAAEEQASAGFLAMAKYAWNGEAAPGIEPSEASAAAAGGDAYEAKFNRALDVLAMMFPAEADKINKNRVQLVRLAMRGGKPGRNSPLLKVQHTPNSTSNDDALVAAASLSPCQDQIINSSLDFVGMVLSLVSITGGVPSWTRVAGSLKTKLIGLGSRYFTAVRQLFINVRNAATLTTRITAVLELLWEIFSQAGTLVIAALQDSLSWWEWVLTGAGIVLGIGSMIASGGTWVAVQLANILLSKVTFMLGLVNLIRLCV